jgi:FkbM family methyltransferase
VPSGIAYRLRDTVKVGLTRYPRAYDAARIPYALGRFTLRVPHEPDYAAFGLLAQREGIFLDVGANAGMSALSFRIFNRATPILSVEPNAFHRSDLRIISRFAQPHRFVICAAGDQDAAAFDLYVPTYRGVPLTTEASLYPEEVRHSASLRARLGDAMDGPEFRIEKQVVPVRRLDAWNLRPAYVKLDVQGAELAVLRGLHETVARHLPVLLVETPSERVFALLEAFEYAPFVFDPPSHALREGADRTNVFFLTPRHAADIRRRR